MDVSVFVDRVAAGKFSRNFNETEILAQKFLLKKMLPTLNSPDFTPS